MRDHLNDYRRTATKEPSTFDASPLSPLTCDADPRLLVLAKVVALVYGERLASAEDQQAVADVIERELGVPGFGAAWRSGGGAADVDEAAPGVLRVGSVYLAKGGWLGVGDTAGDRGLWCRFTYLLTQMCGVDLCRR
jgi:hypothetical protein